LRENPAVDISIYFLSLPALLKYAPFLNRGGSSAINLIPVGYKGAMNSNKEFGTDYISNFKLRAAISNLNFNEGAT
jgi:hypothetical protein